MTDQEELTEIARMELFAGKPGFLGGLSNERELARHIPDEFKQTRNKWADAAHDIFFFGADTKDWAWRSVDPAERAKQKSCLRAVLGGFDLPHETKGALAGWMLAEMLTSVPVIKRQKAKAGR